MFCFIFPESSIKWHPAITLARHITDGRIEDNMLTGKIKQLPYRSPFLADPKVKKGFLVSLNFFRLAL
ncbi:hypothetical protein ABIE50_001768 [Chitinophaga sp. OAE865]